jgi:hypothetical protein
MLAFVAQVIGALTLGFPLAMGLHAAFVLLA